MEITIEIINAFMDAIHEIESLEDYYDRSNNTLFSYKKEVEQKYSSGKKIADIIDELFAIKNAEDRNNKVKEISNSFINKDLKFSDIFEILPFDKDNQNTISFSVNKAIENYEEYNPKEAKEKYEKADKYEYIVCESILSHIIVSFETFLSNIYRILILDKPQKYFDGQTISLSAIFCENFKDIVNDKIEIEVSSKMYNSIATIGLIFEKENIIVNNYKSLLESFKELYYRRNAYVHTKGKANKDYISKVDKKLTKKITINDYLYCDEKYLKDSICILSQLVFTITFELLKARKASENAIAILSNYYFGKLCSGEYELCKYIYKALSKYSSLPFIDRLMYRINYIIACKQLGEDGVVKHELDELDVSAAESRFKIAKDCLSENYHSAYNMLVETYPQSFNAVAINDWPIFIEFRSSKYFKKFVDLHKLDFEIQTIDDKESEINCLINNENDSKSNSVSN